ncbi:1-acyl-sn-glycerol-3-phosphate acyltransferase 3 isoform X3 [Populus trichocarpa]|uniref:1-acyl-sn-glycerol-3-phosphate acyltransferase 3 isoform X3 n=1 Tax=Populus trichocarpa TaxID=3694 RepID=UPI000D18A71F|nr:1-acyl-sn-glycerol-3-phosphate acyltransferase 3 isoform X3 [Populus trichocarpa]|eukprot:XP_024464154.1 1-acyl-sn-glycerol-3-phosphate acyltransferase 3 isoform X3 [Populus trichocarpa]
MAWPAVLVIVPVGIIFILSGLIVNLIQAVLFILVRPVSKSLHRRINKIVAELLWLELIVLVDWWANLKIEVYADDETFELLGKEHALVISNHNSDLDWLVGWILAQRSGCLGSALAVMKKEAKVLPIIGWSMWFSDYVFLERSWGKDERILQSGFERLADFPMPFWLALFVEGTRFTQAKLLAAQEFAASRGIPVPRNVLIPRTKIKVLLERHSMQELPETADGIAQWCKDAFVTKDAVLEKYFSKDIFRDKKLQDIGRPKKSLFVMIFWSSLLAYATVRLFQWLSLFLASWEVITFSIAFLFLVTIIMQILIQSSESERSTPATNFTLSEGTRQRLLPR